MQLEMSFTRLANAKCRILAFPAERLVGRARKVARGYSRAPTERRQDAYWREAEKHLRRQLADAQLAPEKIDRQVASFRRLFLLELARLERFAPRSAG